MPRSINDILEHADELAQRFQDFDPSEAMEVPVEEYLLQRAVLARAESERRLVEAVATARAAGVSWQKIGALVGTTAQAAHQRYGSLMETV